MPKITVLDGPTLEVEAGKRLVLALEDNGVDILHRCGGNARCTTCRVEFRAGEPDQMTAAELERLRASEEGLLGKVRLSCQIICDHDMTLKPLMRLSATELTDAGPRPADHLTPDPVWVAKPPTP